MRKNKSLLRLAACTALALGLATARAAETQTGDLAVEIDALFADWTGDDRPGAAVAVIRDGEIVHSNGFGMADLERGVPITTDSVFEIGSISKQFTAMSILLLEHDGKLSIDDDVRDFIPEMPAYEAPITLRQLLHHTSGIRDIETLFPLAGLSYLNEYPDAEQLDLITRQRKLNFPPGSEYLYSNSGYLLLRMIIERVSGRSLREFAEERIFTPLGMTRTVFWEHPRQVIPGRALAYSRRDDGGWEHEVWHLGFQGPAGLYTTVGDLALWDANFYDNKLGGGAALIEKMETPGVLNSGETIDYAAGLVVEPFRGLPSMRHGGAWMGYRAWLMRFPEQRTTVAVLSNAAAINVGSGSLADVVMADIFESTPDSAAPFEPPATRRLPTRQLTEHAGDYWNGSDALLRTIEVRDGTLYYVRGGGNDTELGAIGTDAFVMIGPEARVDVSFAGGEMPQTEDPDAVDEEELEPTPRTMTVAVEGDEPLLFEAIEPLPEEDQLKIAGTYWSNELQRELRLELEGGQFFVSWTDESERTPATVVNRDLLLASRFIPVPWSPQDVRLEMTYYDSGKVKGLALTSEMVRGVSFVKQQ